MQRSHEYCIICSGAFIVAPLPYGVGGGGRGRRRIRPQVSIPVSRFHELSRANRGGAAAKVIRRRNDSLSAIPGYYGRNQFLQMTHSRAHLARRPSAVPQEWASSSLPPPPPLPSSATISIYLLIEFIKAVTIQTEI